MIVDKYNIDGLISFIPRTFKDDRGIFFESFNQRQFNELVGEEINFVQDNQSISSKDVIRGLHMQSPPHEQGKLVRVTKGKVLDIAVDVRKSSKTYGQHIAVELSAENNRQLWIPPGFAHGFVVLEDDTIFNYKCTNYYNKDSEKTILWNDPILKINWAVANPLLSDKDLAGEKFENFDSPFL